MIIIKKVKNVCLFQVLLMGVLRGVALVYRVLFNRVVAKGLAKKNKLK